MPLPLTKTEIAKFAVNQLVAGQATGLIEGQIEGRTELDTDRLTVHVPCLVAGQLIADRVRPFTDNAVDSAIFNYQIFRTNRQNKKAAKKEK